MIRSELLGWADPFFDMARGLLLSGLFRRILSQQNLEGRPMKDMRAVNLFVNVALICMLCLNVAINTH
jgi:hypothetical protein